MTTVEGQIQIKIEQLLNKINESIPVHWDELYVNIEMNNDGGTVYFFFKRTDEIQFHYSVSIPKEFEISNQIFIAYYREQFNIGREFWFLFKENGLAEWSSAIISYVQGRMNLSFDYTPWLNSDFGPTDRLYYFMYQYLKYSPISDEEKEKFSQMKKFQEQFND